MIYQIDQSGKMENTKSLTIICFANGKAKTLKISAVEKRRLIKTTKFVDYPQKSYIYKIFAALIFLLIQEEKIKSISIDKEYPGHEPLIKDLLLSFYRRFEKKAPEINFCLIGKQSLAHKIALEVFRGKRKADQIIKAKKVLALIYGNKKGWSPHSR